MARSSCCQFLEVLNQISQNQSDPANWSDLLQLGSDIFGQADRGRKLHSLSSVSKKRNAKLSFTNDLANTSNDLGGSTSHKNKSASALLAAAFCAKIEDSNIRAAIRIICSDDKPAAQERPQSCPSNARLLQLTASHQHLRTALQHCRCQKSRFSKQSSHFLQAPCESRQIQTSTPRFSQEQGNRSKGANSSRFPCEHPSHRLLPSTGHSDSLWWQPTCTLK